jgi:hypothetical protein
MAPERSASVCVVSKTRIFNFFSSRPWAGKFLTCSAKGSIFFMVMTIKDKIIHTSLDEVRLYKEGLFWVAYEQSAYFFWLLKGYKPTKKYIKKLQKEVVSIGFPDSVLLSLVAQANLMLPEAKGDCNNSYSFSIDNAIDCAVFEDWKNSLVVVQKDPNEILIVENEVTIKIKTFSLAYKTPIVDFLT